MSTTESVARCIVRLEELSDFLRGPLGERGSKRPVSYHINTVELSLAMLAALEEHRGAVERSVKKLVSQ
jgi:hypothetical protein